MKAKNNKTDISTWAEIKDRVYGEKGTERRDNLERESESFKIGLLLKKARESRNMTQEELAQIIDKKRTYISRVENNGSNITLSTLFDIVEKGKESRAMYIVRLPSEKCLKQKFIFCFAFLSSSVPVAFA